MTGAQILASLPRRFWITLLTVPVLAGGATAAGDGGATTPFAGDVRFEKPVTLEVRDQPLGEFLRDLRSDHHLHVRADVTTQDERVTVFCREQPVGEILGAIAQHLDYAWIRQTRPNREEYVLTQTAAARDRERRSRQALLDERLTGLKRAITRQLEHARLSPEERRQRKIERLERDRDRQPEELRAGYDRLLEQAARLPDSSDAGSDALDTALLAMQPADWKQFWQGIPFRFSYPPRSGRVSLDENTAIGMVRLHVEMAVKEEQTAPEGTQTILRYGTFAGVERVLGEVRLAVEDDSPELRFRCGYVGRQPGFRVQGTIRRTLTGFSGGKRASKGEPPVDPGDTELQQRVFLRPTPGGEALQGDSYTELSDILNALAPAVPYTLIADSYDSEWQDEPPARGAQRLDEWLKHWCAVLQVRVRRQGSTLYFRHPDWPRLRPFRVPDRLSRRWTAAIKRSHALPLRSLAEIAGSLSERQTERLLERWEHRAVLSEGEVALLAENLDRNLEALRLLHTLIEAEWAHISRPAGPPLLIRRPTQVEVLLRLVQDCGTRPEYEWPDRHPRPTVVPLDHEDRVPLAAIRLEAEPVTFFVGGKCFYETDDPREALLEERQEDPQASVRSLARIQGTRSRLALYLEPNSEEVLTFEFLTQDRPAR
jgi:hypothetical protein